MGHTNSTANLSLPQFISTDKPTWLGDVNGAFSAIDTYAGTNDAAVAAAVSDASSAISQAAAAVNTANTANTTAGNASTAANNAIGVANTANAIAGTVDAKVGLLADLNTTDRTSIVNAINEVLGLVPADTVVAESSANATFASQLAEIRSAFTALSADQKRHAVILDDTGLYHMETTDTGILSRVQVTASHTYINTLDITNATRYMSQDGAITDKSSDTNPHTLKLIIQ